MTDLPKNIQRLDPDALRAGELLSRRRPPPPASFRGTLGRRLQELDPGWGPRPERLIGLVCFYVGLGLLLIGLGALSGLGLL